jgi:glutamate racemase
MNSTYEKLRKIKNTTRLDFFVMACTHFFNIGYEQAKEITDKDINAAQSNGLMTKEYVQELMRCTKTIANTIDNAVELVQFCQAEDIYDIQFFANKISHDRLEELICSYINNNFILDEEETWKNVCEKFDIEMEELEMLGYELPEGWEDWE